MPRIIPISDLRNKANEVVDLCHEGEPVFVTRNGEGELAQFELYQKLEEAESEWASGQRGKTHGEVIKALRSRLA